MVSVPGCMQLHGTPCSTTLHFNCPTGFPAGSAVKNPPAAQEPQETRVRSLGQEDPLEEGMATNSSILAWEIPWREEPGGLQSIGVTKSQT